MKLFIFFIYIACGSCFARDFYASRTFQSWYPEAFALMPESLEFHRQLSRSASFERDRFLRLLAAEPGVVRRMRTFDRLPVAQQVDTLRRVFEIEVKSFGLKAPELVIDAHSIPGDAFFEFDPDKGGPGKVFLNLKSLQNSKNKFESLSLLIHETRHSAQFQLSQTRRQNALARGFLHSFRAQKLMLSKNLPFSICDFYTLLNEYEAFQFANYIIFRITNGQVDLRDMGTFAGQYDEKGDLRFDLLNTIQQEGFLHLHERFNAAHHSHPSNF